MELDFWHERWESGQIGFHQSDYNPYLLKHWPDLNIEKGSKVFVPLAGKSNDMFWLAEQGYSVLGVELSEIAVKAFFQENKLSFDIRKENDFAIFSAPNIEIYCGDFFQINQSILQNTVAVFDRASLIALPPELRKKYVSHLHDILPSDCKILLVSMQYPQEQMQGPPFAVQEEEVFELYENGFNVSRLECFDVLAENEKFKEKGLSTMHECIYRIKKKN